MAASTAAMAQSRGEPLPPGDGWRFAAEAGISADRVRVHTDAAAERAAAAVGARAVTTGADIYFGRARSLGTVDGERLLAHELAHVAQELRAAPAGPPTRLSNLADATEREAVDAETGGGRVVRGVAGGGRVLHRVGGSPEELVLETYLLLRELDAARNEIVELAATPTFRPSVDLARYIWRHAGQPVPVKVRLGNIAEGVINVLRDDQNRYQSADGRLPLRIPGLGDAAAAISPLLVTAITDGTVSGLFGGVTEQEASGDQASLLQAIGNAGIARLIEWRGVDGIQLRDAIGRLTNGQLTLPAKDFAFSLDGVFAATGSIAITNETVTFSADATLQVPGLSDARLHLVRDAEGEIAGTGRMAVTWGGFDGSLLASFGRGVLDIRGTVAYRHEDFEGSATLMVTNEEAAWAAVNGQLTQWNVAAMSGPPADAAPATPGALAVAGWGVVDFRYRDWLHGRAQVIVDPHGDITSLGRVSVPRTIRVLEPVSFRSTIVDRARYAATLYSIWAGTVFVQVSAEGSIVATGTLGPLTLHDLAAEGAFSTREGFENHLVIGGRLQAAAALGLELAITGSLAVKARVPVLGHVSDRFTYEVLSTNLRLNARGELEATASATASIHRTAVAGGPTRYLLAGRLDAQGSASVVFGVSLNVSIPGHDFHILDLADRRRQLGRVRGSARFDNYVLGEGSPPAFNAAHANLRIPSLVRGVIADSGVENQRDPDDETGEWTAPRGFRADAPVEGGPPSAPSIAGDPRFGAPTAPPVAPAPAPQGPAPVPGQDPGLPDAPDATAPPPDAGMAPPPAATDPVDAGVPPIAGVPDPPAPQPEPPAEPPDAHTGEDVARFDMEGSPHVLRVAPGDPPVLLMESEPGRLTLKLQRKRFDVDRVVSRRPDPRAGAATAASRPRRADRRSAPGGGAGRAPGLRRPLRRQRPRPRAARRADPRGRAAVPLERLLGVIHFRACPRRHRGAGRAAAAALGGAGPEPALRAVPGRDSSHAVRGGAPVHARAAPLLQRRGPADQRLGPRRGQQPVEPGLPAVDDPSRDAARPHPRAGPPDPPTRGRAQPGPATDAAVFRARHAGPDAFGAAGDRRSSRWATRWSRSTSRPGPPYPAACCSATTTGRCGSSRSRWPARPCARPGSTPSGSSRPATGWPRRNWCPDSAFACTTGRPQSWSASST